MIIRIYIIACFQFLKKIKKKHPTKITKIKKEMKIDSEIDKIITNEQEKIKKKHPTKITKIEKENKTDDKELCPIYSGVAFLL